MDLKTYFQTHSQAEFARALGVTPGAVNQWINGLSAVSAERCPAIEQATGGLVRCEDLRPDVAWAVLRGTSHVAVAVDATTSDHTDALRADVVRRQDHRRAEDVPTDLDHLDRRHAGLPLQSPDVGVA